MALSIALQSIAVFMLSLTINKHFKSMFGRALTDNMRRGLMVCGWVFLFFSLSYLFLRSTYIGISLVWWLSYLSLMIFVVGVIHSRR